MDDALHHSGGCLCNRVRYSVSAAPLIVTICHCKYCQRATGSAFAIEPIFDRSCLDVSSGKTTIYEHRSAGSGSVFSTHFCNECGTKLFITFERWPDQAAVYGGTFDDPDWFEIEPGNSQHIFLDEARRGTLVPSGFKTYAAHCLRSDGSAIDATLYGEVKTIGEEPSA